MLLNKALQFQQVNANTCLAVTNESCKIAKDALSYMSKMKRYDRSKGRNVVIDIERSMVDEYGGITTFPYGCINRIRSHAHRIGKQCLIEYIEPYVLDRKLIPTLPEIKFETFQTKMLRKIGINKRGILVGPTAMGKSVVLGGIIDKLHCPKTIVIVPTQTIFNQMYDHLCKWFGKDQVGRVGQGIIDQQHITVCLYQSIKKYKLTRNNIKLILIDEAHLINNTIIKFLKRCDKVYYRYGLTATPHKPESNFVKAMQMIGYIGPIICEIGDNEASKRVLPVKVKLISYYNGKPEGQNYQSVLRKDVLLSKLRNAKLMSAAVIYALSKGKTCLFLIDETEQGKIMVEVAKMMEIDVTFVHGKLKSSIIKNTIKKLNNREIQCVIATKVFGVGTDIPNVDCVVLASARKSEIDTLQKIGRGRRRVDVKDTDHLIVIDSIDKVKGKRFTQHFYSHSIERLNVYKERGWDVEKIKLFKR
jgi:superfamily II DNA or RNA helicase